MTAAIIKTKCIEALSDSWEWIRKSSTPPQSWILPALDAFFRQSLLVKIPVIAALLVQAVPEAVGVPSFSDWMVALYELVVSYSEYLKSITK